MWCSIEVRVHWTAASKFLSMYLRATPTTVGSRRTRKEPNTFGQRRARRVSLCWNDYGFFYHDLFLPIKVYLPIVPLLEMTQQRGWMQEVCTTISRLSRSQNHWGALHQRKHSHIRKYSWHRDVRTFFNNNSGTTHFWKQYDCSPSSALSRSTPEIHL